MKKILLSLALIGSVLFGRTQGVVLNEIYTDPSAGNSEFLELYNSSGGQLNTDCFTIIAYYTEGINTGFYVMNLPSVAVTPGGFFVAASANNFSVQGTPNTPAQYNWNDGVTIGSYLKKFQRNGNTYDPITPFPPAAFNDFFQKQNGNGAAYHVLVYSGNQLVNAFFGGTNSTVIPAAIIAMPDLDVPGDGGVCVGFTANFSNIADNQGEYTTAVPGNDNGYIRKRDGQCGEWDKGAPGKSHTPGSSNGTADGTGGLTTTISPITFDGVLNKWKFTYSITAGPAEAFPVTVKIFDDKNRIDPGTTPMVNEALLPNGTNDDLVVAVVPNLNVASGVQTFIIDPKVTAGAYVPFYVGLQEGREFFVVFETPQGCFDAVLRPAPAAALPVEFKTFTATRNKSNVMVKWETSTEINNSGFAVERNINGTWEQVAFVPSQALNGNSDVLLSYQYIDFNTAKGITQYRIKQIDIDQKTKYTEIRSVKGDGQIGKVIIYPNPTANGRVNVVFDDASVVRDVNVIDMSGRTIRSFRGISNNNITIDNLTPGIYSLRIFVPETGEQTVEKVVVNQR